MLLLCASVKFQNNRPMASGLSKTKMTTGRESMQSQMPTRVSDNKCVQKVVPSWQVGVVQIRCTLWRNKMLSNLCSEMLNQEINFLGVCMGSLKLLSVKVRPKNAQPVKANQCILT